MSISLQDLPTYNLEDVADDCIAKGGVAMPFPHRLHACLDAMKLEGLEDIASWAPHGRALTIHQPKKFVELVMPRFFGQTKYPSFQRQLNIYGFRRFTHGPDKGAYFHLNFVRGHRNLVKGMIRQKIKNNKGAPRPMEPDFDFYDPAWEGHFEASVPPSLARKAPSNENTSTAAPVAPSAIVPAEDFIGRSIMVPGAMKSNPLPALDPAYVCQEVASKAEEPHSEQSFWEKEQAAERAAVASLVSDESSSLGFDLPPDETDLSLAFFAGSPFHLLEDDRPVSPDLAVQEQSKQAGLSEQPREIVFVQEPACTCACNCGRRRSSLKLVDPARGLYQLS